ncbi:MAG TPA: MFS transporter [Candidatus Saccharimonadales bacterium]|nr:MFS transporter [Candidatus Saccharimonadales bacterium]
MKKRILYLLAPLILAASTFSLFLPSPIAEAATSPLDSVASSYCKSNSSVTNQGACKQGYIQAVKDYNHDHNSVSNVCQSSANVASCTAGYNQSYSEGAALAYCSSTYSSAISDCLKTYDSAQSSGSSDSSSFCQNPPGNQSQSDCQTIWASALSNAGSNNATSPTCESEGDPFDYLLCPIFNSVAHVSSWIFTNIVQPWLATSPISTNSTDPIYQAWSNFRVYGDIFLVIALLVIVFGQSIGGGLIDAYTAKKVLPRLLAAAVLINISIYIVAALVDISNIIGGSIGAIITAPLNGSGAFIIHPSFIQIGKVIGISLAAGWAGLIIGLVKLFSFSGGTGIFAWLGLFVLMPMAFGIIATFLSLVIRKGIILALVLVSPFAFALYCLPNTENVFRRWWKLLLEMLMIYPIVVVIFAISDVLSVTTAGGSGNSGLADIVSFVLQFLPLMFVPMAFKLAGGTIARAHEFMTTGHKRLQEGIKGDARDPWSLQNMTKRKVSNTMLMARESRTKAADNRQKEGRRYGVNAGITRRMFGNDDVRRARANRESGEMREQLTGSGDDWRYRAAFARKLNYWDDEAGKFKEGWFGVGARTAEVEDPNTHERVIARIPDTGTQYSDSQVAYSKNFVGSDPSHYQAGLTYEITKAGGSDEGQQDIQWIMEAHRQNMADMNVGEQQGEIWIGSAFANQQRAKSYKNTKLVADKKTKATWWERNSFTHMRETGRTISTYGLTNEDEVEIGNLSDDVRNARDYLILNEGKVVSAGKDGKLVERNATEADRARAIESQKRLQEKFQNTKVKIKDLRDAEQARTVLDIGRSIADSITARGYGGPMGMQENAGGEVPINAAQTGAPGIVHDAIQDFVRVVRDDNAIPEK